MTDPEPTTMREEDIRPAALMAEKQAYLDWDVNFLLSGRASWVTVACPACDSPRSRQFGTKRGFVYVECRECSTVYTNPRPSLALLHEFYAQSKNYDYWNKHIFPRTEARRREGIFRPRAERTARYATAYSAKGGTMLEVGAGFGLFCEELARLGVFDRIIAVEPTAGLAETCRSRGIETLEMPIERVVLTEPIDAVAAFEVIEHLFSPREFLLQCGRLMRDGGLLILTCPNVRGFDVGTLGTTSGTFDHEHLNYFHTKSLPLLLGTCGFRTLQVETPGKLDVDIVRRKYQEGELDLSSSFFLQELFGRDSDDDLADFQQFIAEHSLSSHMWVVAEKTRR
jgi:2-polyprenyl-3-methyl-5-hydroxy-6-metoxy-1,4-benzoquinol methylase